MPLDPGDMVAIHQVLAAYCHALDEKRWHDFSALFTEDAVFDMSQFGGGRYEGRQAIFDMFSSHEDHSFTHVTSTTWIQEKGDEVHATSNWFIARGGVLAGGVYRDVLVRHGGSWLIHRRTTEHNWSVPPVEQGFLERRS